LYFWSLRADIYTWESKAKAEFPIENNLTTPTWRTSYLYMYHLPFNNISCIGLISLLFQNYISPVIIRRRPYRIALINVATSCDEWNRYNNRAHTVCCCLCFIWCKIYRLSRSESKKENILFLESPAKTRVTIIEIVNLLLNF